MNEMVVGTEELIAKLKALGEAVQGETLASAVQAGGLIIRDAAKGNIQEKGLIRTRNLSRSIQAKVTESSPARAVVEVGTNVEYAAIHEFGGTIRAKNTKYLAIPVGSYHGSPTTHQDLKLRKTGGGTLVMVDAGGQAQYVLKTSVVIPARPYLRPAFDEHKQEVIDEIAEVFKQQIEKAAL